MITNNIGAKRCGMCNAVVDMKGNRFEGNLFFRLMLPAKEGVQCIWKDKTDKTECKTCTGILRPQLGTLKNCFEPLAEDICLACDIKIKREKSVRTLREAAELNGTILRI